MSINQREIPVIPQIQVTDVDDPLNNRRSSSTGGGTYPTHTPASPYSESMPSLETTQPLEIGRQLIQEARMVLEKPAETLDEFWRQKEAVMAMTELFNSNSEQLTSLNQDLLLNDEPKAIPALLHSIDTLLAVRKEITEVARQGLHTLKSSKRGDIHIRHSQYMTCLKTLHRSVQQSFQAHQDIKRTLMDQMTRQLKMTSPSIPEESLRTAVESGSSRRLMEIVFASLLDDTRKQEVSCDVCERAERMDKAMVAMEELLLFGTELHWMMDEHPLMLDTRGGSASLVDILSPTPTDTQVFLSPYEPKSNRKKQAFVLCCVVIVLFVAAAVGIGIGVRLKH